MSSVASGYAPIVFFLFVALGIAFALIAIAFLRSESNPNAQKLSPYECGFEAFHDARVPFDVRFYLVAIFFIIFDLEIAFLFPWALALGSIKWYGFFSMMLFLFVLTVGFVYEWRKGALDWK